MNALSIILVFSIVLCAVLVGGIFLLLVDEYASEEDEHSDTDNSIG